MKILQVTNFFSPVHGGSAAAPYYLSKELARRGHSITIYTSDFKLSQDYINSIPKIKVRCFKTWLSLAKTNVTPGMLTSIGAEVEHFDVIHMHNYRTFQNIAVHYFAKRHGIPYLLQPHGSIQTFFQRKGLKKTFDIFWGNRLLNDASKIIAVSDIEEEQFKTLGINESKTNIVPNGIDLPEFNDLPQRGIFRKKHNLGNGQQIILYLGRIDRVKGIDILVNAFAQLIFDGADLKLVITGQDDGYLTDLTRLIRNLQIEGKVIFTGPLFGVAKLEAYVDADVYVLPSLYEIFGITILEALACGTPVITTKQCGLADVIDGIAGLAVPHEKEPLRHALISILSDEKIRLRFGAKGKSLVRDSFTWEKIGEQIERVYEETLRTS